MAGFIGDDKEVRTIYTLVLLFHVIANINDLEDVVVGTELQRTNVDLDVVFQEVLSQLANFLRPGGTPHQGLTVWLLKNREESKFNAHSEISSN